MIPAGTIQVHNLHKKFGLSISLNRRRIIRAMIRHLFRWRVKAAAINNGEFWALKGIDFNISPGESIGLIGNNGAGKTTLLRVLAGQVQPDFGSIAMGGEIAELMHLTAGYQATLSGRENVFIGGALRGRTKKEMIALYDQISAFAEIEDFMDAPFSSYSQGMKMRLAFAVAVHTKPDILLIDEILSVGDLRFRNKCLGHLQKMKGHVSFILVSHSMNQVVDFCDRALVLEKGNVVFDGPSKDAVNYYLTNNSDTSADKNNKDIPLTGPVLINTEAVEVLSADWVDNHGNTIKTQSHNTAANFRTRVKLMREPRRFQVSLMLYDHMGREIASISDPHNSGFKDLDIGSAIDIHVTLKDHTLCAGTYSAVLSIRDDAELIHRKTVPDLVLNSDTVIGWGVFRPKSRWVVKQFIKK